MVEENRQKYVTRVAGAAADTAELSPVEERTSTSQDSEEAQVLEGGAETQNQVLEGGDEAQDQVQTSLVEDAQAPFGETVGETATE